jgi:iron complex outermembrane receptor protein
MQSSIVASRLIDPGVLVLATLALSLTYSVVACAQSTQTVSASPPAQLSEQLETIVVTAQKRSENLQQVPISVSAITSAQLESAGVHDVTDLIALVPGLQIPSTPAIASPHLRGIGTQAPGAGIESAVAIYIDNVYMVSPNASFLSLNNISQVEVLKGPQSTLFGRNATGGVISITTRTPTQKPTADVQIGYGNYDTSTGSVYVSGPIAQGIASDFAVQATHQGEGYGTNLATGRNVYQTKIDLNTRSKTVAEISRDTRVEFILDYGLNRGSVEGALRSPYGQVPLLGQPNYGNNPWNVNEDSVPYGYLSTSGVSAKVTHDFGAATFTSISAYRASKADTNFDYDLTPIPGLALTILSNGRELTQEFQLTSADAGPLKWTVGSYYFHAVDAEQVPVRFFGPFSAETRFDELLSYGRQVTNSVGGYGQATYAVFEDTDLTAGARYTYERRSVSGSVDTIPAVGESQIVSGSPPSLTVTKPTWRLAIDHRFSPDVMVYVSDNRGFKSGGFNMQSPLAPAYLPEKLDAYEIGAKMDLFGKTVRLNPAAFYYNYNNIQVTQFTPTGGSLYNGAGAEVYGLDLDYAVVVSQQFTLSGGLEYLHTRFTSFQNAVISTPLLHGGYLQVAGNAAGNELPQAPKFTASLTGDYRLMMTPIGAFGLSGTYGYNNGYFTEPDNRLRQPSYNMVSASVKWTSLNERYVVRLWGKNLANEVVATQLLTASQVVGEGLFPPRTYGITCDVKL